MPTHTQPSPRIYYGWFVVAVTALAILVAAGVRAAPGVFILPMQQDTGWSISEISFAVSMGLLVLGFTAPVSGWFIDRYGPRRVAVAGLLIMAASMATSAFIRTPWQLALMWGAFSGVGTGIVAGVMGATVAMRWFVAHRGLVVGIFGASTSAGQLIFVPALMGMATTVGWRTSSLVLAALSLLALVPLLLVMRDDPSDLGLLPLGAAPDATSTTASRGAETGIMQRALRTPEFWLLSATFFICGATSNGIVGTHLIPHAADHGIATNTAAAMLALMGAMNFVGTLASGWLTDRYDPRKLLAVYYTFRGLSLFLLPFVNSAFGLAIFAILFGLDYIATVPPTTALVADTFGRRNVGTVYGWVFCAHQIGAASAAWLGGITRDAIGGYGLAFLIAGAMAVAGGVLALRISRQQPVAVVAES